MWEAGICHRDLRPPSTRFDRDRSLIVWFSFLGKRRGGGGGVFHFPGSGSRRSSLGPQVEKTIENLISFIFLGALKPLPSDRAHREDSNGIDFTEACSLRPRGWGRGVSGNRFRISSSTRCLRRNTEDLAPKGYIGNSKAGFHPNLKHQNAYPIRFSYSSDIHTAYRNQSSFAQNELGASMLTWAHLFMGFSAPM